jgi:hypothetical protein
MQVKPDFCQHMLNGTQSSVGQATSRYSDRLGAGRSGDRIPVGGKIFRNWGPPSLLYNGYRVFPWSKERPGRGVDPLSPSSAVGHERVELYLNSPYGPYGLYRASVPVQGCALPLPLPYTKQCSTITRAVSAGYQNTGSPLQHKQEISNTARCLEKSILHSYILHYNTSLYFSLINLLAPEFLHLIQTNHQPDATAFQFIILTSVYS